MPGIFLPKTKSEASEGCLTCGLKLKLHHHHIFKQSEHPELKRLKTNIIILCAFCHQRVHAIRPSTLNKIHNRHERFVQEIYAIAPSFIGDRDLHLNVNLIAELQVLMKHKFDPYVYCLDCDKKIGLKNRAIFHFLCDNCRR